MKDENRFGGPEASDAALDEALREFRHELRADPPKLADARVRVLEAARAESVKRSRRVFRGIFPRLPARRWVPVAAAAAAVAAAVVVPPSLLPDDTDTMLSAGRASEQVAPSPPTGWDVINAASFLQSAALAAELRPSTELAFPARLRQHEFLSHVVEDQQGVWVMGQARVADMRSEDGRVWRVHGEVMTRPRWLGRDPGHGLDPDAMDFAGAFCASSRGRDSSDCVDSQGWYRPELYRELGDEERPLSKLNGLLPGARETPWRVGVRDSGDDVFDTAIRALSTGVVPARVRAAMYRELASLPGVHVTAEDVSMIEVRNGRVEYDTDTDGVAIGIDDADTGQRREIVVHPSTGEFLGARAVALEGNHLPGVEAGTVLWSLTIESIR